MKKKYILGMCLGLSLFAFTGCQKKEVVSELSLTGVSGDPITVRVTDENFSLKELDDGFMIKADNGSIHGSFITEIEANNAMANYYNSDSYHDLSVQSHDGFGYLGESGSVTSDNSESSNSFGDIYHHVLELESGDRLDLACSSEEALNLVESSLEINAGK